MPLVSKTFDQLLDFTRTSAATFVGSNGFVQNTPASVNLLTWTQQFDNAAWTKTAATVTANTTVAPDGTSTADTVAETATTASPWIRQQPNVTSGATYTGSVYVKKGGGSASRDFIQLVYNTVAFGANAYANFNIASGTVTATGAGVTASISDAGNGWYRCSITGTAISTGSGQFFIAAITSGSSAALSSYLGDVNATTFLWGAQLEAASAATTYTRNNGGVFPPRFDYDPATLAPKGLLIEEQRTNLMLRSEEFDNASWSKNFGGVAVAPVVTANAGTSPDGTMNADRVQFDCGDTTSQTNRSSTTQGATISNATAYRGSIYIKAYDAGNVGKTVRITSDNVGTTVVALTADWTRVQWGGTSAATASNIVIECRGTYTTQTADVLIYGAQLEAGAFATSYIPTVASQVTRTADQCSIVAPNFAPWYNQSEGTFVFEGTVLGATGFSWPVVASDNTAANRLGMYRSGIAVAGFIIASNVTQMEVATTSVVANVPFKIGVTAQANSGNFSFNGNIGSTDTTITMPVVNKLSIGASASGSAEYLNGHIRSIRYYPVRLSNTQLQALTA